MMNTLLPFLYLMNFSFEDDEKPYFSHSFGTIIYHWLAILKDVAENLWIMNMKVWDKESIWDLNNFSSLNCVFLYYFTTSQRCGWEISRLIWGKSLLRSFCRFFIHINEWTLYLGSCLCPQHDSLNNVWYNYSLINKPKMQCLYRAPYLRQNSVIQSFWKASSVLAL